jgi:hypothetical protein
MRGIKNPSKIFYIFARKPFPFHSKKTMVGFLGRFSPLNDNMRFHGGNKKVRSYICGIKDYFHFDIGNFSQCFQLWFPEGLMNLNETNEILHDCNWNSSDLGGAI